MVKKQRSYRRRPKKGRAPSKKQQRAKRAKAQLRTFLKGFEVAKNEQPSDDSEE